MSLLMSEDLLVRDKSLINGHGGPAPRGVGNVTVHHSFRTRLSPTTVSNAIRSAIGTRLTQRRCTYTANRVVATCGMEVARPVRGQERSGILEFQIAQENSPTDRTLVHINLELDLTAINGRDTERVIHEVRPVLGRLGQQINSALVQSKQDARITGIEAAILIAESSLTAEMILS